NPRTVLRRRTGIRRLHTDERRGGPRPTPADLSVSGPSLIVGNPSSGRGPFLIVTLQGQRASRERSGPGGSPPSARPAAPHHRWVRTAGAGTCSVEWSARGSGVPIRSDAERPTSPLRTGPVP